MNTLARRLILICLAMTLSACAGFNRHENEPQQAVDEYLAEQQYSKAMAVIASVSSDSADFDALQKKRKQILREINQFETESIKLKDRYKSKNQWPEALAILDDAIKKLPTNQRLIEARQQLLADRDLYISDKKVSLSVVQANSLPSAVEFLEAIDKAEPGIKSSEQALLINRGQMDQARQVLMNQARIKADSNQWQAAREYLLLVTKLGSNEESRQLLASADKQLKLANAKSDRAQQLAYLKKRDEKLDKLAQAVTAQDFLAAKSIAKRLRLSSRDDLQVTAALANYQQTIDQEVNRLTDKGQQLYTKGHIDMAIQSWKTALQLDPGNADIQERLRRAETFQSNIKKYK